MQVGGLRKAAFAMVIVLAACGAPEAVAPVAPEPAGPPPVGTSVPTTTTTAPPISEPPPSPSTTAPQPPASWVEPPVPEPVVPPPTTVAPVALEPGARGAEVALLQKTMAQAGFFRDAIDGVFGERTAAAVVAVHKALDAPRSSTWAAEDWASLEAYEGPRLPVRADEPDRIEIDLTRQLLFRLEADAVVDVIPVSTGNGALYQSASGAMVRARTPRGDFALYKHHDGWRISYLGGLYRPWYFSGGYAIHGSASVPPVPASHGCVRIPNWEADHLAGVLSIGLPVHVWD